MIIIIVISSILALAFIAWVIRKMTSVKICPICAGVAGTWLWLLGGMFLGFLPPADYQILAAILMGGSVTGIAYQIEKKIIVLPPIGSIQKSSILFKALFIPAGFVAAYSLLLSYWLLFILTLLFLAILSRLYTKSSAKTIESGKNIDASQRGEPRHADAEREEIKKRIENCC